MKKISLLLIFFYIINSAAVFLINENINKLVSILFMTIIYTALYICITRIYIKTKRSDNILFFLLIIIIAIQGVVFFNHKNTINSVENRILASLPKVNPFHENFAEKMDTYINDRIGLRNEAIEIYSKIPYINDYNIQNKVIKGINGWLYLNDRNNYLYYQGVNTYSNKKLNQIKDNIKSNMAFCEKNNIKLITIIPPDKATIYPEYYNLYIKRLPVEENYRILKEYIENIFPNENIILPYNEMINAKKNQLIYFIKDSHWNSHGAYSMYKVLAEAVVKLFPAYSIIDEKDIIKCDRSGYTYNDLEKMLGIKNIIIKTDTDLCPKGSSILNLRYENVHQTTQWKKSYGSENAPKILLIHDSFMVELAPFIEQGASEIGSIWTYDNDFNKISDIILSFKPDLIIWERVERLWAD